MSTTREQLRDLCRLHLADEAGETYTDAFINQAIADALDDYSDVLPRELSGTVELSAGVREYALDMDDYPGLQMVFRVEYPVGDDPPEFLTARSAEDPEGFYGRECFDVWGREGALTLVLGPEPVAGEDAEIRYWADHLFPDGDDDELTVPDRDLNLLCLHVWRAAVRRAEMAEIARGCTAPELLSSLRAAVEGAEQAYAAEWARRGFGEMP